MDSTLETTDAAYAFPRRSHPQGPVSPWGWGLPHYSEKPENSNSSPQNCPLDPHPVPSPVLSIPWARLSQAHTHLWMFLHLL